MLSAASVLWLAATPAPTPTVADGVDFASLRDLGARAEKRGSWLAARSADRAALEIAPGAGSRSAMRATLRTVEAGCRSEAKSLLTDATKDPPYALPSVVPTPDATAPWQPVLPD